MTCLAWDQTDRMRTHHSSDTRCLRDDRYGVGADVRDRKRQDHPINEVHDRHESSTSDCDNLDPPCRVILFCTRGVPGTTS